MATFRVQVTAYFLDAAERTASVGFVLQQEYDDAANAGAGNMEVVMTAAEDLITALNVLTMASIPRYEVAVLRTGAGSPNVAANNQVRAFTRVELASTELSGFSVPSWDDVLFDQDSENLLSAAYNTAAGAIMDLVYDLDKASPFDTVLWSQSRTHKSRNVLS